MYVCARTHTHFLCKWKAQRKVSVGYELTRRLECSPTTHFPTLSGNISLMSTALWRRELSTASHIFSDSHLGRGAGEPPWVRSQELKSRDSLRLTAPESAWIARLLETCSAGCQPCGTRANSVPTEGVWGGLTCLWKSGSGAERPWMGRSEDKHAPGGIQHRLLPPGWQVGSRPSQGLTAACTRETPHGHFTEGLFGTVPQQHPLACLSAALGRQFWSMWWALWQGSPVLSRDHN